MRAFETILRTQIIAEAHNYMYFTAEGRGLYFERETSETIPLHFKTILFCHTISEPVWREGRAYGIERSRFRNSLGPVGKQINRHC